MINTVIVTSSKANSVFETAYSGRIFDGKARSVPRAIFKGIRPGQERLKILEHYKAFILGYEMGAIPCPLI
jgi:hypothetical protein